MHSGCVEIVIQNCITSCLFKSLFIVLSTAAGDESLVRNVALLALIPFALAFAFIVFILYRSKREAVFRDREAALERKIADVEMKALRAQMNPHFLFNCLNSINSFINLKQSDVASSYLIKFSNLVRMVLENSMHREVPLEDDLKALELYIQMEQMRLDNRFTYHIDVDDSINAAEIYLPPLLLQPFVENAVWHGLSNRQNDGNLSIFISVKETMLQIVIEDNGIIRSEVAGSIVSKKSLGMSLTRERLNILKEARGIDAYFNVTDRKGPDGEYAGKRVELLLPVDKRN